MHSVIARIDYRPLCADARPVDGRYRTAAVAVHADGSESRVYVTHTRSGSRYWVAGGSRWIEVPRPVVLD